MNKARPTPQQPSHLGMLEITRVTREAFPLSFGEEGYTSIGALVDQHISNELAAGNELQTLTLHLADESRAALCNFYMGARA